MTEQVTVPAASVDAIESTTKSSGAKKGSLDQIAESFQSVGADISEIGKLSVQEKIAVTAFLELLRAGMESLAQSVPVDAALIPIELGSVSKASVQPDGQLMLCFDDGSNAVVDLALPQNRDLMMAVLDDFVPKYEALALQAAQRRRLKPAAKVEAPKIANVEVQIPLTGPTVAPQPLVEAAIAETALPEPQLVPAAEPAELPPTLLMLNGPVQLLMLPAPQPASEEPQIPEVDHTAALLELRNAAIQHALQETLGYLGMLGAEVFEQPPYSRFYDDWMGNLRQTIYSFQTHWAINADEAFFDQTNRILEALAVQLLKLVDAEAQSDAQAKALLDNRTLLSSLDAGYAAKTEQFVARGKSMLERLLHNAQTLESELAAVKQIKVDLRHPLQLLAKEQKTESLGQRLDAARRRLAYAVSAAAVNPAKAEKLNPQWGTQSCELEKKREAALAYLRGNVSELQAQIEEVKARRTSNPVRKVANQQQIYEFSYQLYHAQKRLEVAEKTCSYELDYLKSQYENQKQTALSNVQTLERDLQAKPADASQVRRMEAAKALSELVKAYAAQKTTLPLQNREPKPV